MIYAFQLLNTAYEEDNFEIILSIKTRIWSHTDGILQGDEEGFSNEEGCNILWQFQDDVSGEWNCAVRDKSGSWTNFIMDLGDESQRKEFRNGQVPKAAKRI